MKQKFVNVEEILCVFLLKYFAIYELYVIQRTFYYCNIQYLLVNLQFQQVFVNNITESSVIYFGSLIL